MRHFVFLLGALGALICVAGILGIWYVESRIDRAREQVFKRVDQAFSDINRRLIEVRDLAEKTKITLDEIQQRTKELTKEWTKKEARERLVARFDVDAKAQQFTAGLRQAELMLDVSYETVQHLRQALEVGAALGLAMNADSVNPLLARIEEIKDDLSGAIDTAEGLRQRIGENGDDKALAERVEQVAKLAARLLTTFGKVDARLDAFQSRLADTQKTVAALDAKTHSRVVMAAVCATLFLLWMGAGQLCLWRWARNR